MNGKVQYNILTTSYSRNHLLDQGKKNGVQWEEDRNKGVNWLRFSLALIRYLEDGNEFYTDDADEETLQAMMECYSKLRELQKKLMLPHLRASMSKIVADKGVSDVQPMDTLSDAYNLLEQSGGSAWADKVRTLVEINQGIAKLNKRLNRNTGNDPDGGQATKIQGE